MAKKAKKSTPISSKDSMTASQLFRLMGTKTRKIGGLQVKIKGLKAEIKDIKRQIRKKL